MQSRIVIEQADVRADEKPSEEDELKEYNLDTYDEPVEEEEKDTGTDPDTRLTRLWDILQCERVIILPQQRTRSLHHPQRRITPIQTKN